MALARNGPAYRNALRPLPGSPGDDETARESGGRIAADRNIEDAGILDPVALRRIPIVQLVGAETEVQAARLAGLQRQPLEAL
jgi:hypothetical protein